MSGDLPYPIGWCLGTGTILPLPFTTLEKASMFFSSFRYSEFVFEGW